jgi:phospholipid-binding lipoprotein MlaA
MPALFALTRGEVMRDVLAAFGIAAVCAAAPTAASAQEAIADPWQGMNRDLFAVHEAVDGAVLEPVARGYRAVTPQPLRTGVLNFLRNLRSPATFANDVLQGEAERAGVTAARFGVNTTIGLAGLFDPATTMGLARHDEDFGQTLAVWGVAPGPYLFVPLLGPTTVRDGAGRIVDLAFDPLNWAEFDDIDTARTARTVTSGIAAREAVIEAVDDVRANSLDPYVSIRSSYGLLRQSAIENGRGRAQDLPELEDIPEPPAVETPTPTDTPKPVG